MLALLLALVMTVSCAAPAYAENGGRHSIEKRSYTTYVGSTAEDKLNQEIPLYFMDGVDDLPYLAIEDWAELRYFVNTAYNDDSSYGLTIKYGVA